MKNFTGKLALVTGGSSGIGLSVSKKLAGLGVSVWILARREEVLKTALEAIKKEAINPQQKFGYLVADVSNQAQVESVLSGFLKNEGTPDILVNDAGASRPGYFLEQDVDVFRWMMDVNFMGVVHVTKCIAPGMAARGSGHIVMVGSMASFLGGPGYSAYGASKYALRGFSDSLRIELKMHHVKMSIVFPPDTDTPQHEEEKPYLPPLIAQMTADNLTVKTPDQVAGTIIDAIKKDKYIVLPGTNTAFMFHLNNFLGAQVYHLMDYIVADAQKKLDKKAAQVK